MVFAYLVLYYCIFFCREISFEDNNIIRNVVYFVSDIGIECSTWSTWCWMKENCCFLSLKLSLFDSFLWVRDVVWWGEENSVILSYGCTIICVVYSTSSEKNWNCYCESDKNATHWWFHDYTKKILKVWKILWKVYTLYWSTYDREWSYSNKKMDSPMLLRAVYPTDPKRSHGGSATRRICLRWRLRGRNLSATLLIASGSGSLMDESTREWIGL